MNNIFSNITKMDIYTITRPISKIYKTNLNWKKLDKTLINSYKNILHKNKMS